MNIDSKQILAKLCPNNYAAPLTLKNADILIDIPKMEGKIDILLHIKPSTSRTSIALSEAIMNRDKLLKSSGLLNLI